MVDHDRVQDMITDAFLETTTTIDDGTGNVSTLLHLMDERPRHPSGDVRHATSSMQQSSQNDITFSTCL